MSDIRRSFVPIDNYIGSGHVAYLLINNPARYGMRHGNTAGMSLRAVKRLLKLLITAPIRRIFHKVIGKTQKPPGVPPFLVNFRFVSACKISFAFKHYTAQC